MKSGAGLAAKVHHRIPPGPQRPQSPKYQRTAWKNTGAEKHSGATRSSSPTAPVTDALPPQLRTPASRFKAFITNSPSVPLPPATKPITPAAQGLNGGAQYSRPPHSAAANAPMNQPRHENVRLIARATGR